jgi:hypothetical protein
MEGTAPFAPGRRYPWWSVRVIIEAVAPRAGRAD